MNMKRRLSKSKSGGRRPPFDGACRPVTVTLPESTLQGLSQVDPDRGRAIVKLTEARLGAGDGTSRLVEVVEMAEKTGLLVVAPSQALRRIPFLHLVEVATSRFILALEPSHDFQTLEIAVLDLLDDVTEYDRRERDLLSQLLEQIRRMRQTGRISMAQILFVRMD